jgi:hypothetical protein
MIVAEASTSSTSFRVTPCPSMPMCHSGSAGQAPAPLVSPEPKNLGNKLATALPMSPHCDHNHHLVVRASADCAAGSRSQITGSKPGR